MKHPSKHSSWWRRLEDVFYLHLPETSSRRLDQEQYIRLGHKSSRRLQDGFPRLFQEVLQKRLLGIFKTSCQDFFTRLANTSSKHPQNVFKTLSRHLKDVLQRCLQDVFKPYHQKLKHVSESCCKDGYLQKDLPRSHSEKFMVSV